MATAKVDTVTKQDLDMFGKKLSRQIVDQVTEVVRDFATQVDERFTKNEASIQTLQFSMSNVERRLDSIEQELADVRQSLDKLTQTIDGFVKRLDDVEIENTARDAQFRRLLDWAQKVSAKTGIPLKY